MSYPAPNAQRYLDARVNTASQPELQLLMLDGALRFGRQARSFWNDESLRQESDQLLRRTLDLVEELARSVSGSTTPQSERLEEEYAFAFRELTAAQLAHDAAKMDSALKLLEFQRETWRLACEKLKASTAAPASLDFGLAPATGFSFQA